MERLRRQIGEGRLARAPDNTRHRDQTDIKPEERISTTYSTTTINNINNMAGRQQRWQIAVICQACVHRGFKANVELHYTICRRDINDEDKPVRWRADVKAFNITDVPDSEPDMMFLPQTSPASNKSWFCNKRLFKRPSRFVSACILWGLAL